MKICDICGTFNLKENNYCTHCGNKLVTEHFCHHCGAPNLDYATTCAICRKQINPICIDDYDVLFTKLNEDLLADARISDIEYQELLNKIFMRAEYIPIYGNTAKEKILNLSRIFTPCKAKSRGYEWGYNFLGNCIYYDDRLDDSIQIATVIHELAHYFIFTIFESLLCDIFKVETSPTLQSFVWYFLTLPEFKIMNEYCAHTVEGRFVPYGYQNYGSFNALIESTDLDDDSLETMVKLGNSFANEIIVYLENYIGNQLREEIKLQYKKDSKSPKNDSVFIETDGCFSLSVKNSLMLKFLHEIFIESSGIEARKELELIKEGIEINW